MTTGLKMPRLALRMLYGSARDASRSYGVMHELYLGRLAGGARATGPYVPPAVAPESPGEARAARTRILDGWRRTGDGFVAVLRGWRDEHLDRVRMPHPILGKLTGREMLFFTHFHDRHHLESVRRRTEAASQAGS